LKKLENKQIEPEYKPEIDETGLNCFDSKYQDTFQESLIGSEVMKKISKEESTF